MNDCKTIKEITNAIVIDGASADDIIPLDLRMFSKSCVIELLMLYIKYGKDEQRMHECKKKLEELMK